MTQKSLALALGVVLLAVLLFVGAATLLPHTESVHAGPGGAPAPAPIHDPSKGIHQPPAQTGLGYMPAPASGKTLSDGQIKSFVETHPFLGGDVVNGAKLHLIKVEHLTPPQFKKMRGVKPQLPDTEQLAFVTIGGPFHLNRVDAPKKEKAVMANQTTPQVYLLIDIQTGNLQGWFL